MAKIPYYNQGALASSVVGVPPLDRSGQMMAETILNATGQEANALTQMQGAAGVANRQANNLYAEQVNAANRQWNSAITQGAAQVDALANNAVSTYLAHQRAQQIAQAAADKEQEYVDRSNAGDLLYGYQQDLHKKYDALLGGAGRLGTDGQPLVDANGRINPNTTPYKPEDIPQLMQDWADEQIDRRAQSQTPGAALIFKEAAQKHTVGLIDASYSQSRTLATQQAQQLVDQWKYSAPLEVTTPDQYTQLVADVTQPGPIRDMLIAGSKDVTKDAHEVLARSQVSLNNAQARSTPNTILENPDEWRKNYASELTPKQWDGVLKNAKNVANGVVIEAQKKQIVAQHGQILSAEDIMSGVIRARGESPTKYGSVLATASKTLNDMLNHETSLPIFKDGDPTIDKQGNAIPYQSKAVITNLERNLNDVDNRIEALNSKENSQYAQQLKAFHEQDKQDASQQLATIAAAQQEFKDRINSPEGKAIYTQFTNALTHLKQLHIPDEQTVIPSQNKATKAYRADDDSVTAFARAVNTYAAARAAGVIDEKAAVRYQQTLKTIGMNLKGDKPQEPNDVKLQQSLVKLVSAAPQDLHYILSKYSGYSKSAVDRELLSRTLDMYNVIEKNHPGAIVLPATVDKLRAMAKNDMLAAHAARQNQLVPPPPPVLIPPPAPETTPAIPAETKAEDTAFVPIEYQP